MTPRIPYAIDTLTSEYGARGLWEAQDQAAFLRDVGPTVRVVVTNGVVGCPTHIIDALPNLRLIAVGGVGLDAVDLNLARARGIQVTTAPDVLTADVADQAVGLLLAASRQIIAGDRYVRDGGWERGTDLPLTWRVSGKRAGIIGLGQIGKAIAKRLAAMDMPVLYTGRREQQGVPYTFVPDALELARSVDVLVVAAAATPETRGVVNADVLTALGSRGVLVNIARGSLVDETALADALASGRLGAAGLDVFADEPNVPAAFKALSNVVLAPHAATRTIEGRQDIARLVLQNVEAFFAGRPLVTPIDL